MSLEFPFKYAKIEGIGNLFYPTVFLEIKTIYGWREFEFLVDTGADITTIPTHLLFVLGLDKTRLPTSTTLGVGGYGIKAWDLRLILKLGKRILKVQASAVETREEAMPLLLGRKDIFEERFNLTLDSRRKLTIISENY